MAVRTCFFPLIGGKFNLLKALQPLAPPHHIYVEVFGGAANLLLNKPPSPVEVYNDIDSDLVNLFLVIRDRRKEFVERFKLVLYSRGLYKRWFDEPMPEDAVERAVRFYYIMRCSFGGNYGASWAFKRKAHKHAPDIFWSSIGKIEEIAYRLKSAYIDALDFRICFRNWDTPETFFFCDPPYYGLDYYRHNFSEQDHRDLRGVLEKTEGRWLLTYGDHPEVRRLYEDFKKVYEQECVKALKKDQGKTEQKRDTGDALTKRSESIFHQRIGWMITTPILTSYF